MKTNKQYLQQGFSLIELMVVVVIIGVIIAVVAPSYQSYITNSYRSDAYDKLTEVMFQMERYKTKNRTYTIDLADLGYGGATTISNEDYYTISAVAGCGSGIARCVTLNATARQAPQTNDTGCTTISMNSQGVKSPADCW